MKNLLLLLGLIAVSLLLVIPTQALAVDAISVNVGIGKNEDHLVTYPLDPTAVAGFVADDNWNNAFGNNTGDTTGDDLVGMPLNDGSGNATTAVAFWQAPGYYTAYGYLDETLSGDHMMRFGRLEGHGDTVHPEITISGIPTAFTTAGYDVYVYSDRIKNAYGDEIPSGYRIGAEEYWTTGDTSLVPGELPPYIQMTSTVEFAPTPHANYARFEGLTGDSFTLNSLESSRSQVNGIQIVSAGENINLNFAAGKNLYYPTPYPLASDAVAGVIPVSNWNNITNNKSDGTPELYGGTDLVDSTGAVTTANLKWSAGGTYSDSAVDETASNNHMMMKGRLEGTPGLNTWLEAYDLPADLIENGYDVYVYHDSSGDGVGEPPEKQVYSRYSVSFDGIWYRDTTIFDGEFREATGTTQETATEGANYCVFRGLTGNYFRLDVQEVYRSAVQGIQIVASDYVPTSVPGDANRDGKVDEDDAQLVAANWGSAGGWDEGDFDNDGVVGPRDAAIMAANWGHGSGGGESAVPEPSTLVLLLGGLLCLFISRNRAA